MDASTTASAPALRAAHERFVTAPQAPPGVRSPGAFLPTDPATFAHEPGNMESVLIRRPRRARGSSNPPPTTSPV